MADDTNKHDNYKLTAAQKKTLEASFKQLKKYEGEIEPIKDDIKDIWGSLKDQGFNVKAARAAYKAMKAREADAEKYDEEEQARDLYFAAIGLI